MHIAGRCRLAVLAVAVLAGAAACMNPTSAIDRRSAEEELPASGDSPPRIGGYVTVPDAAQRRTGDPRPAALATAAVISRGGKP